MIVLAHPLTQAAELPVSPLVLALAAVYLLITVSALDGRRRRTTGVDAASGQSAPRDWDSVPAGGPRRAAFWAARSLGLALFLLVIVDGRIGDPSQVRNIAPALTIGVGWPLVTLASVTLGAVWWWVNPYDTLARAVSPLGAGDGSATGPDGTPPPVWWAVPAAVAWMLYLTVWPDALAPRALAAALIAYTLVTLAGCLAMGRRTWLSRAEFFTVFFDVLAAVRRGPTRWAPPDGAAALLGVVSGGALFGLVRDSDLGILFAYGPRALPLSRIAVVVCMAVAGLLADRVARRTIPGSAVVGLAPLTAMLVVALAISRNRLTTSLQLLPIAASSPLGWDRDLFGTRFNGLDPRPLGDVGPVWLQVGLLLAGAVASLLLTRRFAARRATAGLGPRRTTALMLGVVGGFLGIAVAAAAAI